MARRSVAPALTALLSDLRAQVKPGKEGAGDAQVLRVCAGELAALKAVARAASRNRADYYDALPLGASSDPLCRALARLERVGGGRGRHG